MRSEGTTFLINFEHVSDMEEIALKQTREVINEAKRARMTYSKVNGIMTRALETIKLNKK